MRWSAAAIVAALSVAATAGSADSWLRPVGVSLGAVCILWAVRRHPAPGGRRPMDRWMVAWMAVLAIAVAFQVLNFVRQPRRTYPTLSSLTNLAFENHAVRAGGFALWLVLGWYLLRR